MELKFHLDLVVELKFHLDLVVEFELDRVEFEMDRLELDQVELVNSLSGVKKGELQM